MSLTLQGMRDVKQSESNLFPFESPLVQLRACEQLSDSLLKLPQHRESLAHGFTPYYGDIWNAGANRITKNNYLRLFRSLVLEIVIVAATIHRFSLMRVE